MHLRKPSGDEDVYGHIRACKVRGGGGDQCSSPPTVEASHEGMYA